MLTPPNRGEPLRYALILTFKATNNEAEHEALITGLIITKGVGVASLKVYCDSQLVVNQVKGEYITKGEQMKKYLREAKTLVGSFVGFQIMVIPIEYSNKEANALSKYV